MLRELDIRVAFEFCTAGPLQWLHAVPAQTHAVYDSNWDDLLVGAKLRSISDKFNKGEFYSALAGLPQSPTTTSTY